MIGLVLVLVIAIQVVVIADTYAWRMATRIWEYRSDSALARAALLLEGDGFDQYVRFARETIPEDARVILPPRLPIRPYAHIGLMQYFLFPRDIHNCGLNEVEECTLRVNGPNTYILALRDFPPRELAEISKKLVPFDDERGIYAPR